MAEADILYLMRYTGDSLWSLLQYRSSVSFGILIASYLVATMRGYIEDPRTLGEANLSHAAQATLDYAPVANSGWFNTTIVLGMFCGMFLLTLSYPIYCKLKQD